jgi:DDE_Tnp_1-associated
LALFTLAISAGCRGFLAIQDWLSGYHSELLELFTPPKSRLPSYSTIRRVLLELDYEAYSRCLARFFQIEPRAGETIAVDGKVLCSSYNHDTPASTTESHPTIQLVTFYVVERGLILPIQQVDCKQGYFILNFDILYVFENRAFQLSELESLMADMDLQSLPESRIK